MDSIKRFKGEKAKALAKIYDNVRPNLRLKKNHVVYYPIAGDNIAEVVTAVDADSYVLADNKTFSKKCSLQDSFLGSIDIDKGDVCFRKDRDKAYIDFGLWGRKRKLVYVLSFDASHDIPVEIRKGIDVLYYPEHKASECNQIDYLDILLSIVKKNGFYITNQYHFTHPRFENAFKYSVDARRFNTYRKVSCENDDYHYMMRSARLNGFELNLEWILYLTKAAHGEKSPAYAFVKAWTDKLKGLFEHIPEDIKARLDSVFQHSIKPNTPQRRIIEQAESLSILLKNMIEYL